VICESTFDLYDEFIKVYKRKKMVRPFAEKKQAAMRDRRATGIAAGRKSRVSRIRTDSTTSAEGDDRPLLDGGGGEDGEDGENEGEDQKAAAFISQARAMAGVGKIPDDAEWLTLYHQDEKTQQLVEGGKLAVSIQIVTKAELTARPSGFGRDDPNVNPFLPPPVGRMQLVRAAAPSPNHCARAALGLSQLCFLLLSFSPPCPPFHFARTPTQQSMNPLDVMKQLMGPEIWRKFCCCVICVLIFIITALLGSTLGPFITLLK